MSNEAVHEQGVTNRSGNGAVRMVDVRALRVSAVLLALGVLFTLAVGLLHPGRELPNYHPAVFAEYAADSTWTAIHMGQFVGFAIIAAGLLFLYNAINVAHGTAGWAGRFAAVAVIIALALYGVLQAVDGVALKRAVDAWVSAPEAEKAVRFASAQAIRWVEEALRSYYDAVLGLAFLQFGIEIARSRQLPRPMGYLMGLIGLFYLAAGWTVGEEGFSAAYDYAQLPAYILLIIWVIWLVIAAWRLKGAGQAATA